MKQIFFLVLAAALILSIPPAFGDKKPKGQQATTDTTIQWLTLDEVQAAMKRQPKKVYIDMYTDWCGWCKVMDRKTFSNKHVISYMNEHFYAVKLNAEQRDSIRFLGKMYGFSPEHRANQFAVELVGGRMSYPTSIFMEENFQNPQPVPGYLDVTQMEMILNYFGGNLHRSQPFDAYQQAFQATWQ